MSDVLTTRDVNEIANAPAGAVPSALTIKPAGSIASSNNETKSDVSPSSVSYATVRGHGNVTFEKDAK